MELIRAEYQVEDGKPVVYLFTRENGKRITTVDSSLIPYFYVPLAEENNLAGIRKDNQVYEAIDGTKVRKVYVTLPEDVPKIRDKYSQTWEADIIFQIRYMIDKVDSIEKSVLKVLFIDIETDSSGRVPNTMLAPEPIICVTIHDSLGDVYTTFVFRHDLSPGQASSIYHDSLHEVHYFKTEEDLLQALVKFISDEEPDVISGWNSSRFDLPYLVNRMKRLNIKYNKLSPMGTVYQRDNGEVVIKGVATVDLYDTYRRFTQNLESSYKLDFIGMKVVGIGKTESANNIKYLWKHKLDNLIEYNTQDVRITVEINKKLMLLDFLDELRRLSFCNLEDCLSTSRMADSYILRLFHGKKIFPTKIRHEKTTYEGAFVGSWAEGIYNNVVAFDLKSLYPSIIVGANLSPETIISEDEALLGNNICINGVYIRKDKKGFLPEVIESLFKERVRYKELMNKETVETDKWKLYYNRQYALKTLLNALYGQTAYPGSRIYKPIIAETITYIGRRIITWSKDFLENIGYKVLYVDTDSLYFSIGEEIDMEQIDLILNLLNDSYNNFVKQYDIDNTFEIEFEKIYRRAFFGKAKKKYAGHVVWKLGQETDTMEIVGMEVRRSDVAQFSRNLQEKVLDMLLHQDKPKDEVLRYIGDEIDRIRKGRFTFTEIGIPKGINKDLSEYGKMVIVDSKPVGEKKGISANIRGAIYATKILGHELSSKPKMVYVKQMPNGYESTNVLCFDENNQVPPGTAIDVEKMLDKLVKSKLESIFEAIGWKMSTLNPFWKGKSKKGGEQLVLEL